MDAATARLLPSVPASVRLAPVRYLVLVSVAFAALLVLADGEYAWMPWTSGTVDPRWGELLAPLAFYGWAVAPAVAIWRPVAAGLVVWVPFVVSLVDPPGSWPFALFVSLVASAAAATWRSPRAAVVLAGSALLPVVAYAAGIGTIVVAARADVTHSGSVGEGAVVVLLYAVAAALGVGAGMWMRTSYLAAREAAALAGRADEVERVSAAVGERARLARDLHDVVAHHVSLIAVRAETAPYTVTGLSPDASNLLAEIAGDARRALDELRGVLGILGRSIESVELAPQPSAADVDALVEASRRAGDDIVWTSSDLTSVSPSAGYVAYRVVQEALTNARRHAPGAVVRLTCTEVGAGVLVVVENDLRPDTDTDTVPGRGLVGMRERVEGLGGRLSITRERGVLRVVAAIPGRTS